MLLKMDFSGDILQSFKINAIQQYGTNNIIYMMAISIIFSFISQFINYDWTSKIFHYQRSYMNWIPDSYKKKSIVFEGKMATRISQNHISKQVNFSNKMNYIWEYLNDITNGTVYSKAEYEEIHKYAYRQDDNDTKTNKGFMIDQKQPVNLGQNIWCEVNTIKEDVEQKKSDLDSNYHLQLSNITLTVYSYLKSLAEIEHFLDTIFDKYEKLNIEKLEKNNKKYIFNYQGSFENPDRYYSDNNDAVLVNYSKTEFHTSKCFSNTFFEQREELMKKLEFFVNNEDWYKKMGIPYTFGIILHGPPGTGKTSIIKCIAQYLDRHIVNIDLNRIQKNSELNTIFFSEKFNNIKINQDERILVLEDIDAMDKIVIDRNDKNSDSDSECDSESSKNKKNDNEIKKVIEQYKKEQDYLTLSQMLNIIDGIHEGRGRVLIMTTNHYKKLDRALVRPGRIDMNLEIKNANKMIINQICEFLYGETISTNDLEKVPEYKWSCAEIYQMYFSSNSFEEFYQKLISID